MSISPSTRRLQILALAAAAAIVITALVLLLSPPKAEAGTGSFYKPMGRLNWGGGYYTRWSNGAYRIFCEEPYYTDDYDNIWWRRTRYDVGASWTYSTVFNSTDYYTAKYTAYSLGGKCRGTYLRKYSKFWTQVAIDGYNGTADSASTSTNYTG